MGYELMSYDDCYFPMIFPIPYALKVGLLRVTSFRRVFSFAQNFDTSGTFAFLAEFLS
jgi:hypothetical protein